MKKKILISLNLIFLFIFSFLIPKKKRLFVFGDGQKDFKGNSKYLYLYSIYNLKNKDSYFIVDSLDKFKNQPKKLNFELNSSLKVFWLLLRAEFIFVNGMTGDVSISHFLGRFRIINLWHGTPIKKIMFDDDKSFLNNPKNIKEKMMRLFSLLECKSLYLICAPNKIHKKIFSSAFKNKNVEITGYPRNDIFYHKNLENLKKNIRNKLNLDKNSKVILYAPTYRDDSVKLSPFSNQFLEELNNYLKKSDNYLLIKKHPLSDEIIPRNYSNIVDISSKIDEIHNLYLISDILISDYSSVYFDFILLNKPMISYFYDFQDYIESNRNMYFELKEKLPGPFAFDEKELLNKLKRVNKDFEKEDYMSRYQKISNEFNYYKDGNSCKRIMELISKK